MKARFKHILFSFLYLILNRDFIFVFSSLSKAVKGKAETLGFVRNRGFGWSVEDVRGCSLGVSVGRCLLASL